MNDLLNSHTARGTALPGAGSNPGPGSSIRADSNLTNEQDRRTRASGGRFGITDVIAHDSTTPDQRAATEARVGCAAGTLTHTEYRELLTGVGFHDIRITTTVDHGDGITSAILQARKAT